MPILLVSLVTKTEVCFMNWSVYSDRGDLSGEQESSSGWWFRTCVILPSGIVIPSDFHIVQMGGSTTNQYNCSIIYIYIYTYVYITYINIYIHISPHLNHVEVRRRQHCWAHPPTGHARARLPGNAFRWWIELDLLWLYPLRCGMDPLSPTSSPQKSLDTLYRTLTRPLRPPKWPLQASVYTSTVPVSFVILHVPPPHLRNIHNFFLREGSNLVQGKVVQRCTCRMPILSP